MTYTLRTALLATAAALALPSIVSATTINEDIDVNTPYVFAEELFPQDDIEFVFTALNDLMIDGFGVSASGNNAGTDVGDLTFGFTSPGNMSFLPGEISVTGSAASASTTLDGLTLLAGESFSFYFNDGIIDPVGVTLSFSTSPVAVPVPAAGLLLATALLGGAAVSRKKKAA